MTGNDGSAACGPAAHGSFAGGALLILAGPMLWAGHFFLVYGTHAGLCGHGAAGDGAATALVFTATAVVLLAQLAILLNPERVGTWLRFRSAERRNARFVTAVSRWLAGLAMLGVVWAGAAAAILEPCSQLR
jgi:hypothetical protein